MEIIGRISGESLIELWDWVQSLSLSPTAIVSRYAPNRWVKCFGIASNLQSIAKGRARLLWTDDPGERIRWGCVAKMGQW
ncbi:hypothetical protein [Leptolyngbya sp. FACHB-711]|uniref:hypothetical protein n=1 Tax=Leptolyngbya sp. FACHB-711 TaxID=2692813 RepID=UPI0016896F5A|nr:hypothetical protein [Leptolyngbya sp. FACHB-711]MBD2023779.1 hypothetical protein [Leptolyngbya sp. FACHB-711]